MGSAPHWGYGKSQGEQKKSIPFCHFRS